MSHHDNCLCYSCSPHPGTKGTPSPARERQETGAPEPYKPLVLTLEQIDRRVAFYAKRLERAGGYGHRTSAKLFVDMLDALATARAGLSGATTPVGWDEVVDAVGEFEAAVKAAAQRESPTLDTERWAARKELYNTIRLFSGATTDTERLDWLATQQTMDADFRGENLRTSIDYARGSTHAAGVRTEIQSEVRLR